jgi:glyoxylase-like metal-dependent hydrolase (beta-lactamase superfamily II)
MANAAPVMMGLRMPDVDLWSERVVVALGQNPSPFTGPGTNTYLVGTGSRRILLDAGSGIPEYLPVLDQALDRAGCQGIQEIVLTHGHPDHIGGVAGVIQRHGTLTVSKRPAPADRDAGFAISPIDDGDRIETEGATLLAVHTPGHARDHLCFVLEEERALFSGDHVLGVGTAVIPPEDGSLLDYMNSLERLLEKSPGRIYPAHGPRIEDGCAKLREYLDHRRDREQQILNAMASGASRVGEIVKVVYAAYPEILHAAAGQSVTSHLLKLEQEGRATREGSDALAAVWRLS